MQLFTSDGQRKYMTATERDKFKAAALELEDKSVRMLCLMLLYTGCRISEGLNVMIRSIDYEAQAVTFESLKKRRRGIFRQVPLPSGYLDDLDLVFEITKKQKRSKTAKALTERLWPVSRATASRKIDDVMQAAGLSGIQATPKGLRHSFAIHCLEKQIPLNLISRWMGHSSMATTAIYANAIGQEERSIAERLWSNG